ncbi:MAG: glycosyltransferase family 39 protein [Patescibacteria group bacterium]
MWKKTEKWIVKWEILLFILIGVAIFRIPNLFEPYWYGDEGIYLGVGRAINSGVRLYSQIHDNKPPLLYWIAALTSGEQFWYRLFFFAWMLLTTVIFYKIASRVVPKSTTLATLVFAILTTWPSWEGNIANAELFFLLPILSGFGLVLTNKSKNIFWGGVMYGLAILFKVPAGFSLLVWPVFWILEKRPAWLKKCLLLGTGVLIPILITFGISFIQGSIAEYTQIAWLQNIPYLSSWTGQVATGIFSIKVRGIILALALAVTLGLNKRWGKLATILGVWALFDLFAALLSARPYPHYLLQMAPAVALLLGVADHESRARWVAGGVAMLLVLSYSLFGFYHYRGVEYYANFGAFVTGQKSLSEYRGWFDGQVNNNYVIAETIKSWSDENEKIFVWGDQPTIYPLSDRLPCGRYLAKYHVLDFFSPSQTWDELADCKPKIIVDMSDFGGSLSDYMLVRQVDDTKIYRRMK